MESSEKPKVKLIGEDSNAFMIMGLCTQAARKAGWPKDRIKLVMNEMMSSDYDGLLQTAMKYFEVR